MRLRFAQEILTSGKIKIILGCIDFLSECGTTASERKYYIYKAPTNLFQRFVEAYAAENDGKGKTKEAIVKESQVSSHTCARCTCVYKHIHQRCVVVIVI